MRPKKYTNLWHKNKSLGKYIILCAFSRIIIVGSALGPVICLDRGSVQRVGDWEHSALNGSYIWMERIQIYVCISYVHVCTYIHVYMCTYISRTFLPQFWDHYEEGQKDYRSRGIEWLQWTLSHKHIREIACMNTWCWWQHTENLRRHKSSEQREEEDRTPPWGEQLLGINFWEES